MMPKYVTYRLLDLGSGHWFCIEDYKCGCSLRVDRCKIEVPTIDCRSKVDKADVLHSVVLELLSLSLVMVELSSSVVVVHLFDADEETVVLRSWRASLSLSSMRIGHSC